MPGPSRSHDHRRCRLVLALTLACLAGNSPAAARDCPPPAGDRFGAEVERLRALRNELAGLAPLLALIGLEDFVVPERLDEILRETAAATRVDPLVAARAEQALALRDERNVRPDDAAERRARIGMLSRFWVVGPFDGEGRAMLDSVQGPEREDGLPAPGRAYPGKEREVHWRRAEDVVRGGALELDAMLRPDSRAIAYVLALVWSDTEQDAALRLGSPGGVRVWCNGSRVLSRDVERTAEMDQDVAGVHLGRGWNRLLVKTAVVRGAWRVFLRLTAPDGTPLQLRQSDDLEAVAATLVPRPGSLGRPVRDGHGNPGRVPEPSRDGLRRAKPDPRPRDPEKVLQAAAAGAAGGAIAGRWRELGIYLAAVGSRDRQAHAAAAAFERAEHSLGRSEADARLDVLLRWAEAARDDDERRIVLERAVAEPGGAPNVRALALARLGDVLRSLRREALAVERWRQALALDRACWPAAVSLSEEEAAAGLPSAGLARLDDLPGEVRSLDRVVRARARLLLALGRRGAAESSWEALRRRRPGDTEALEELSALARTRGDAASSAALLRVLLAQRPDVPSFAIDLARTLEGAGDAAGAAAALQEAVARVPDEFRLRSELGKLLHRLGRRDEALVQLQRALALRPQTPELRRYVDRLTSGASGEARRQAEDLALRYATDAAGLLGREPRAAGGPDAARVLLDRRVVRVHPNGLSETFAQRLVEIVTDRGAEDYREFSIRYTPGDEDVEIREARILRRGPHGEIETLDAGERDDEDLSEPWYGLYYDTRAEVVRFEGLRAGDVIEVQYLVCDTAAQNELAGYFGDFQLIAEGLPKRHWEYVLLGPASRPFHFNQPRVPGLRRSESTVGSERAYSFAADDVPRIEVEPAMPGLAEVAPYLHVSTYRTWEEVAAYYARLIDEQLQPDEDVRQAARNAVAGKIGVRDKIRALHALVITGTRYVGLEFGIHGFKPYRVAQVWQRRFGDCKDKASLLVAMLREVGIPAELALVRTRRGGRLDELPASLAVFDHALAYVPGLDLYLDGTAEWAGVDELPAEDQGVMALRTVSRPAMALTPVYPSSANRAERRMDVTIDAEGQARIDEHLVLRGQAAPEWRQHYQTPGERLDRYGRVWSGRHAGAKLQTVRMPAIEDREQPVVVDSTAIVPHFGAGAAGDGDVTLPLTVREAEFVRSYARLSSRRHELVVGYPWQHQEQLTFRLPPGWTVGWLPAEQHLTTRFGELSMELSWNPASRQLVVRSSVDVRQNRVPPADYAEFRRFLGDMDAVLGARITVVMGTLGGFPSPPAMGSGGQSPTSAHAVMGTLGGFPSPPAMGSGGQSPTSAHAIVVVSPANAASAPVRRSP